MIIPEKVPINQLHRTKISPEACGLYTMRRGFQWSDTQRFPYRLAHDTLSACDWTEFLAKVRRSEIAWDTTVDARRPMDADMPARLARLEKRLG
jgi:hypothetical protein